jgi:peroxiredoxin
MTGKLTAGALFPKTDVPRLGGGTLTLGAPAGGRDWQLVVVYRGKHCPQCHTYLSQLDAMQPQYHALGVDVVAVSADPEPRAQAIVDELGLTLPMGYDLTLAQMASLGLYVSDPRNAAQTDRPFAEPGSFVVDGQGGLQIVNISNAPFCRPDLDRLLAGLSFDRGNDFPIRGLRAV